MFNITFQQIEAFLAVAKYLNLSKAADSMFITPSALSKMLQRFEEGMEIHLFNRSNQGLTLTDKGEYLFISLETLYNSMNKAIVTAKELPPTQTPSLRIALPSAFDTSTVFDPLKNMITQYRSKYPQVKISEFLGEFRDLRQALEYGSADLVFTQNFSVADLDDISFKCISKYVIYLAMSAKHPLAAYDEIQFDKLGDEVFYTIPIPREISTINDTLAKCRRMGFSPKALEFVPNLHTLIHNIRQGSGMSICGNFDLVYNDIKCIPLPESENNFNVIAAWRTGKLSNEASKFIELLA
jgi:DNA-binding transcriptional LysR family regulator